MKNPIYISMAIFFWLLGFSVIAASKMHYSYFEAGMIFGRSIADFAYYTGEHLGRVFLMIGCTWLTFMLERYDYNNHHTMYAKNISLMITGLFFVRMIGEICTYSIVTKAEIWCYLCVVIVAIIRTIHWLIKH